MKEPNPLLDPYEPEKGEEQKETSEVFFYREGTIPPPYHTSETVPPPFKADEESSLGKLVQAPLPSTQPEVIRGKTVAKWAIDRRRTANSLFETWKKASRTISEPSFAVYVNVFIDEINKNIPLFRDIPYEDAFPGILQLLKDALTGENFCLVQKNSLGKIIDDIFDVLVNKKDLTLAEYKSMHERLGNNNLLRK